MAVLKASTHWWPKRSWKCRLGEWSALLGFILLGGVNLAGQPAASKEYQIKALFLFNFAQFVAWPTNAFSETKTPLVIGILGDDPFGDYLDETVRGEKVHERPLMVQRYRRVDEIGSCHILFVSRSESTGLDETVAKLRGRSILTVGDVEGFTGRGGMIQFLTEKNKLRLRINLEAAKAAHLTISSKLLRPAEIVASGKRD